VGDSKRDPGDFGRRVSERRRELGLSREEVAHQAGVDAGYLEYLEESANASATRYTVERLAIALRTTVPLLQGEGFGEPVGAGQSPAGTPELETLDRDSCLDLIHRGGVGRVAFVDDRGPIALPVNFGLLEDSVIFHTGRGRIRAAVDKVGMLGIEIDHLDATLGEGWSVLVTGEATVVTDADVLHRADELRIHSWIGGDRTATIQIMVGEVTGRRIRRHL